MLDLGQVGRKARLFARSVLGVREVTIDGVRLAIDRAAMPPKLVRALLKGAHEAPERAAAKATLRRGDRVLECGSGVGLVSLVCARIVGAENLLCYEADPIMAALVRRNFSMNGLEGRVRAKAVATHSGEITFYKAAENVFTSSTADATVGAPTRVPCDDFAAVVAEHRPSVIVMDIEGAEVDLLPSADLSGVRALVIELHPRAVGEDRIAALEAHLAAIGLPRAPGDDIAVFRRG